ncbi:hypothetical protein [Salimicrobium jeotgali]|nr:hypothetical protein [Salimicrobium jeotgali]
MFNVELTENEKANLLVFLDRVDVKGLTESQALLQVAQKVQNAAEES